MGSFSRRNLFQEIVCKSEGIDTIKTNNLLLNKKFQLFWSGQTISMFGSQITIIALPLTAIYLLDANSLQMGIFQLMATVPFFLFSLFAGVWIDQSKKKPLLVISNLATAFLLLIIPLSAWFEFLNFYLFYLIIFLAATFSMIFELAYLSFLPLIVKQNEIANGNSKLEISRSIAQFSGPSIGGALISIFTAPIAILLDALSYFFSTILIWKVKVEEPQAKNISNDSVFKKIKEGLRLLIKHPILKSISASTAVLNFFRTAFDAIYILFIVNFLSLSPVQVGIVLGVGSVGALLGAFCSESISRKIGIGPTIMFAVVFVILGGLIVPFVSGSSLIAITLLILGQTFSGFGNTIYFISQVSLRQAITPFHILGRINASNRFISRGAMPLGGLFGGILGMVTDLKWALLFIALGYILSLLLLYLSPIKKIKVIEDAHHYNVKL